MEKQKQKNDKCELQREPAEHGDAFFAADILIWFIWVQTNFIIYSRCVGSAATASLSLV